MILLRNQGAALRMGDILAFSPPHWTSFWLRVSKPVPSSKLYGSIKTFSANMGWGQWLVSVMAKCNCQLDLRNVQQISDPHLWVGLWWHLQRWPGKWRVLSTDGLATDEFTILWHYWKVVKGRKWNLVKRKWSLGACHWDLHLPRFVPYPFALLPSCHDMSLLGLIYPSCQDRLPDTFKTMNQCQQLVFCCWKNRSYYY